MYSVVQFTDGDGGSVSIVNNNWFTPRRCEVFWPPVKGTKAFERVLVEAKTPDPKWKLYGVDRVFCETDNIEKAKKKLKLVEVTSDLQTESETEPSLKRKRTPRYVSTSSEEDINDIHIQPPPLKKKTINKLSLEDHYGDSRQAQPNTGNQETPSIPENLAEDGEGRVTPVTPLARLDSPPNIDDSDVPATPSCQKLTGYQGKVLSLLSSIKTQNDQIISLLKHTGTSEGTLKPELKFPIQNADELNTIESLLEKKENHVNLVSYMRTFGGRDISSKVFRIMKYCFTDQIAEQYNFYGKRSHKKPFCQLRLRDCIVEGVVTTTSGCTAKEVEDSVKIWLKHAPQRLNKSSKQK